MARVRAHGPAAATFRNQEVFDFTVAQENIKLLWPRYFFKNALNKSIGNGKNVVVLCSLAISRMVCR